LQFSISSTAEEWTTATSNGWNKNQPLPLPPGLSETEHRHIQWVAKTLAARHACPCPVDIAVGIGPLGEISVRLFALITGTPVVVLSPDGGVEALVALAAGYGDVLVCAELGQAWLHPTDLSAKSYATGARLGFVCPYNVLTAVVGALKAALVAPASKEVETIVLDGRSREPVDYTWGRLTLTFANSVTMDRVRELLERPCHIKVIAAHGNAYDYSLGPAVLCGIEGPVPQLEDAALFPCFQTGTCLRGDDKRVHVGSIRGDVLFVAACWGFLDGAEGVDLGRTAMATWLRGPDVGAVVATAVPWTSLAGDCLRLLASVHGAPSLGDATRRLNTSLDPGCSAFVLFGNPRAPLGVTGVSTTSLALSRDELVRLPPLPAGVHLIEASEVDGRLCLDGDAPGAWIGVVGVHLDDERRAVLVANSHPVVPMLLADRGRGPRPTREAYARLAHHVVFSARIEPLFVQEGSGSSLAPQLLAHARSTMQVVDALADQQVGETWLLTPRQRGVLEYLDDGWLQLAAAFVERYVSWCTGAVGARFLLNEWQQDYRRAFSEVGSVCDVCHLPTRLHCYHALDGVLPGRHLRLCRLCSTKSDLPADFALEVRVLEIVDNDDELGFTGELVNPTPGAVLVAPAMFFMSAYRTWAASAATFPPQWLGSGEALPLAYRTTVPEDFVPGDHWFVVVGMVDGAPFTWCTRARITRRRGVRGPVLYRRGDGGLKLWQR
jgi:hypothetical protein